MGITAAVAGASGYAGGELLRFLLAHPDITVGPIAAGTNAGHPVAAVHPHLSALADRTFDAADPALLGSADVVFLALPHGESAAVAAQLPEDRLVVDLGADHRLADASRWEQFYGTPYAGRWTYGLPELPGSRSAIRSSTRIAAPGCYPTAAILGLAPLLRAGLVEPGDVVIVAASGTTGAGRAMRPNLMSAEVMGALSAYKVGGTHQHTPEIEQALTEAAGTPVTVSFTPVLAPMPRGILSTATARLAPGTDTDAIRSAFEPYTSEPFVFPLPDGQWPHTGGVLGSNAAHIQATADVHAGRAVVVVAIDNLGKGAAGQAVQCANLALGLPETAGLTSVGVAP
ncbi:MAG: N-acetyl-gamma-glutamyl-phosphate reductase [Actinomycetes bacterium]